MPGTTALPRLHLQRGKFHLTLSYEDFKSSHSVINSATSETLIKPQSHSLSVTLSHGDPSTGVLNPTASCRSQAEFCSSPSPPPPHRPTAPQSAIHILLMSYAVEPGSPNWLSKSSLSLSQIKLVWAVINHQARHPVKGGWHLINFLNYSLY